MGVAVAVELSEAVELLLTTTIGAGVTSTTGVTGVVLSVAAGLGSKTFKSIKVPTVIA